MTNPLSSSSANRLATVVEDESTLFLISEKRIGADIVIDASGVSNYKNTRFDDIMVRAPGLEPGTP